MTSSAVPPMRSIVWLSLGGQELTPCFAARSERTSGQKSRFYGKSIFKMPLLKGKNERNTLELFHMINFSELFMDLKMIVDQYILNR